MLKKDLELPKPWSDNEVLQRTYFCNVRREHDRVTRFIRSTYSPYLSERWFEYNIIFSRFINWPATLSSIGFIRQHTPSNLESQLERLAHKGKVWGGAYVITTHGIPMGKAAYLCHNVLGGVARAMETGTFPVEEKWARPVPQDLYDRIRVIEGDHWIYEGPLWPEGYGKYDNYGAHRYMWLCKYGPINTNTPHVLHRCEYKNCCNPDHLFLGTNGDNFSHEAAKGVWDTLADLTENGRRRIGPRLLHGALGGVAGAMENALGPFWGALRPKGAGCCKAAHMALQGLEGLGSFLAAQVVADLKNTPGHPLYEAFDKATFVAHGPGSLRGLQWFWEKQVTITPSNFMWYFMAMKDYVDENWNQTLMGAPIDNQDLQNCLCEFDKFMRVTNGTGKSKRNYPGIA